MQVCRVTVEVETAPDTVGCRKTFDFLNRREQLYFLSYLEDKHPTWRWWREDAYLDTFTAQTAINFIKNEIELEKHPPIPMI